MTPTSELDSSFTDSSSTLFSLYLSHAEKYDKDQTETWKAGAEGILVFVCSTLLFGFIISSFVNGTLTNNYSIIPILDRTVRRCHCHIRGRQLQVLVARLCGERRHPPRTNIPATRWPFQRDSRSDPSFSSPLIYRTTVIATSLRRLGELALVSQPRHISFLCLTRNSPATLGSQVPRTDATSRRDP